MLKMNKKAFGIIILTMAFSCAPTTKEKYMADYKRFVDEVAANYKSFTPDDWRKANETFEQFNNEWYNKFKHEFSIEDKFRITGYQVKYNAVKAGNEMGKFYDQYLKNDVDELRAKIKYYVDNDMDEDLKKFTEEAKKISKELEEEVRRIVREFEGRK
jgi:hypothetical protein